jgi:hypothetical protein
MQALLFRNLEFHSPHQLVAFGCACSAGHVGFRTKVAQWTRSIVFAPRLFIDPPVRHAEEIYPPREERRGAAQHVLVHATGLRTLVLSAIGSFYNPYFLGIVASGTSFVSLKQLTVDVDSRYIGYLFMIGALAMLEELVVVIFDDQYVLEFSPDNFSLCDKGAAWDLPCLRTLSWDMEDTRDYENDNAEALSFLARCSLPRLQELAICICLDLDSPRESEAAARFSQFLEKSSHITRIRINADELENWRGIVTSIRAPILAIDKRCHPALLGYLSRVVETLELVVDVKSWGFKNSILQLQQCEMRVARDALRFTEVVIKVSDYLLSERATEMWTHTRYTARGPLVLAYVLRLQRLGIRFNVDQLLYGESCSPCHRERSYDEPP